MKALSYLLVTVFYIGRVPFAPGTAGSAVAILYAYACSRWADPFWYKVLVVVVPALLACISVPAIIMVERWENRRDPGFIVIDEFFGQLVCFYFVAQQHLLQHPWLIAVGFLLFRFFDIRKPLLIKQTEAIGGGAGVIADDALAGLYSGIILGILCYFVA